MKITTITMGAASALAVGVLACAPTAHADPMIGPHDPCAPAGATKMVDAPPGSGVSQVRVICRADRLGELIWQADWTQIGGSNAGMGYRPTAFQQDGPCLNTHGAVDVQACNACIAQHGGVGPFLPGGQNALQVCSGNPQPMQFPQCDKYNGDLMSHQICADNVARGLPPDNIRRP